MAVIRNTELREMTNDALQTKLKDVEGEILRELGQRKTAGRPANAGKYRELKKVRARIKTMLGQRGVRV